MFNKKKLFFVFCLILPIHLLFAYENNTKQTIYDNMIIPVPTYIPNNIDNKSNKIILKNLKKESSYSYTIYKLYINKCQKKDVNKKYISPKAFNKFLNSDAYQIVNKYYMYQQCSLNPHIDPICQYILKIKNKPKIKCFKTFNF